jgi:uncharacterized protein (DUF427 family)
MRMDLCTVTNYMATGHKITIAPAGVHVKVSLGGETLAESDRAVRLDETGIPARYYIPRDDVRADLLRPSAQRTTCPFKGEASYWSVQLGDDVHENLVWSYETPIAEAAGIEGLLCFYDEKVDLRLGEDPVPASSAESQA